MWIFFMQQALIRIAAIREEFSLISTLERFLINVHHKKLNVLQGNCGYPGLSLSDYTNLTVWLAFLPPQDRSHVRVSTGDSMRNDGGVPPYRTSAQYCTPSEETHQNTEEEIHMTT